MIAYLLTWFRRRRALRMAGRLGLPISTTPAHPGAGATIVYVLQLLSRPTGGGR